MKKKAVVALVIAGALTVGIAGAIPSLAANNDQSSEKSTVESDFKFGFGHNSGKGIRIDPALLEKKAAELGIETKGKETRELAAEIRFAELQKQAKELGIETANKDARDLAEEIQLVKLQEQAKELGIETEDKDVRDLAEEVRKAQLLKEAKELGITSDGKELRDLAMEVRESQIKKQASDLGLEVEGKELNELAKEVHEAQILQAAKKLGIDTTAKTTEEIMKEIFTNYAEKAKELELFPGKQEGFGGFQHGEKKGKGRGHGPVGAPFGDDKVIEQHEQEPAAEDMSNKL